MYKRLYSIAYIPLLFLVASFATVISLHKTIAPVDIYTLKAPLYSPGNALKVKNTYLTDINEVYLPWKYYLYAFHPQTCVTLVTSRFMTTTMSGVLLPQGICYPLDGVRLYLFKDIFWPLTKFLDFFTAYDLSYLLSLIFIYLAALFFFSCLLGENPLAITLCSATLTTSFPIARDLQYEGLSQTLPLLMISLGLSLLALRRKNIFLLGASFVTLFLSTTRSSLQSLGFIYLFFFVFCVCWFWPEIKKAGRKFMQLSFIGLFLAVFFSCWYHQQAIQLFLSESQKFLPTSQSPFGLQLFKRIVAFLFSSAQFFLGDFLFSFNTIDFSKILGNLGTRDYFSYDGNNFFANPLVAFYMSITLFNWKKLKHFPVAWIVIVDFLVFASPIYRILYFRFHQWWMLINILLVFGFVFKEDIKPFANMRKNAVAVGTFMIFLGCMFFILTLGKTTILAKIGQGGTMGFEKGFWPLHLERFVMRVSLRDYYSLIFLGTAIGGAWLANKKWNRSLIGLITASGLVLNIFFYNFPQNRKVFFDYKEVLMRTPDIKSNGHDNVNLLINRPARQIYESLFYDLPEK